ncbi:hypothetical protein Trco_002989 [Trichoderma cornu-damae]|uniref:Uncharacterized protein n=1 Tax=Trichoderma cornu-damae TaxID=654480 RepID=A0A9P8QVS2_9HYPO|nr:hypothetical protein Trco_002989 [Trichoderma cornu-damae]
MLSLKLLLLLPPLLHPSLSSAAVIPRNYDVPAGYCCFALADVSTGKTIQQNKEYGFLYLDASQPKGWYCLNPSGSRPILWDDNNNACIIAWDGHFQCLDPTPGDDEWSLGHVGTSNSTRLLLLHNSSSAYQACPNRDRGEIISSGAPATAGCRKIQLEATGLEGACSSFTA